MKFPMSRSLVVLGICALAPAALASFHLMQIEQVIGGVYGDNTAQAIQLRLRGAGESLIAQGRLRAFDASGGNPVLLVDFTTNVSNAASGARVLIATSSFAALCTPTATPDFTMSAIPPSYLAAGSLTYERDNGSVLWRISWGGGSYTGPTTGETTNDSDGDFGVLAGSLITSDARALRFLGSGTAKSSSNSADYETTRLAAVFTKNSGASFTLTTPVAACPNSGCERGDLNGDCKVDMNDLNLMLAGYGTSGKTHAQGDADGDGSINLSDLAVLLAEFNTNCN